MEGDPRQSWFVQWIDSCCYCFYCVHRLESLALFGQFLSSKAG